MMVDRRYLMVPLVSLALCLTAITPGVAQEAPETILYNGKVLTVDDPSFAATPGTIAQAIAIRNGRILAVGTDTKIRGLAGAQTKSIDLNGRTVMPGIIDTHDHPQDWDQVNPYVIKKVISDDVIVERFLDGTPDEQLRKFLPTLDEALHKAKPGQWIRIVHLLGRQLEWITTMGGYLGTRITKQHLYMAAPNNPVIVRTAHTGTLLNQKALDELRNVFPDLSKLPFGLDNPEAGTGSTIYRIVEPDVMLRRRPDLLAEIYEGGLSWTAGYGITTIGTLFHSPSTLTAYRKLEKTGKLPLRLAWGWGWPAPGMYDDPYFMADLVARTGEGSDLFWFAGAWGGAMGRSCSTLPGTSSAVKEAETCAFTMNEVGGKYTYEYIKAGGRVALIHTEKDKDIDNYLDVIERASKDAGITLDQIRAKRHTYDHSAMSPRPDQVERLAKLGMMVGGTNLRIYSDPPGIMKNYGERGVQWIVPRKSLNAGGVMNTYEIDRALSYNDITAFWVLAKPINLVAVDGKVYAENQRIDRIAALKSATIWGSYYVLREKTLGSLEAGKWADLLVLDRDYMTIPEEEIAKIRVLMTMVGGKMVHLVPSLARAWGMQPTGAQVELGGAASQY